MCNRASFAKFSGLRLDPDFVEIPAHVLENWYVCVVESFYLSTVGGKRRGGLMDQNGFIRTSLNMSGRVNRPRLVFLLANYFCLIYLI